MWVLPINDDEFLAWSRFQVGLAVTTGVLVIVITTAAVILLGRAQAPGTGLAPRSPSASASKATPSPTASATASPTAVPTEAGGTPTPKTSTSKKPSATPPPVPVTFSLSCDPEPVPVNERTICTITLSAAQAVDTTFGVSTTGDVSALSSVTIAAGSKTVGIVVTIGQTAGSADITVTMPGNGSKSFTIHMFEPQTISVDLSPILRLII